MESKKQTITEQLIAANDDYKGRCTNVSLATTISRLDHPELTDARKVVLIRLALYYNNSLKGQGCHPTTEELAKSCSVSLSTAKKAIKVGQTLGFLRWVKLKRAGSKDNAHNSYDFRGLNPSANIHWRGGNTKLVVVSEGNLADPVHDGRCLKIVEQKREAKTIVDQKLSKADLEKALSATESKQWRIKLQKWMDSEDLGFDKDRRADGQALIRLNVTLTKNDQQAMANTEALINFHDSFLYPKGFEFDEFDELTGGSRPTEIEAIEKLIYERGYPVADLTKFIPQSAISEAEARAAELASW